MGKAVCMEEQRNLYMEFSKHFIVVQIMGEWRRLWMCVSIHLKVKITLKMAKIKNLATRHTNCAKLCNTWLLLQ
jgi:hypothetical protein